MKIYLLAAALLCCAGLGQAVEAAEADFRLLRLEGSVLKWGKPRLGAGARVTYAIADQRTDYRDARNCEAITSPDAVLRRSNITWAKFMTDLRSAFAAWQRVADITFHPVADPERADIVIGAQVNPTGYAFTNVDFEQGEGGVAKLRKSVICLNPQKRWKSGFDGDEEVFDLRFTLIHEIGHAIGLDHPSSTGQIMDYRYTEAYRRPQFGDMAGITQLYGASLASGPQQGSTPQASAAAPESEPGTGWPRLGLGRE